MTTLIFGTCYIDTEPMRDLVRTWFQLCKYLNPDVDVILIDSASPFDPRQFLPCEVFRFDDNIGHLSRGGGDGAGRAFCKGIEIAIERDYDYAVHWEADMLFARPVQKIVNKIDRTGVQVACALDMNYQFCEWGISFFFVPFMKAFGFLDKYDWRTRPAQPLPEVFMERLFEDFLFLLPLRGMRNDFNMVNRANFAQAFPMGPPDYCTHNRDAELNNMFLAANGITLGDRHAPNE